MKRKMKVAAGCLAAMLYVSCCLGGCASKEMEEEINAGGGQREEKQEHDLAAGNWREAGEIQESAQVWTLMEYKEDFEIGGSEAGMLRSKEESVVDGTDYYVLESYADWNQLGEECQKYYLTCVDMLTMESKREKLALSAAEKEGNTEQEALSELAGELAEEIRQGWAMITGMDVREGKICLLILQMDKETKTPAHCYAVWLDENRNMERAVDLLPELEKAGMCQENAVPEGILSGGEEQFYVGTGNWGIFNDSGEFQGKVEAPGGAEGMVFNTCRLPDGRPVFEYMNYESGQSTAFCMDGLEDKILFQGKCDYAQTRYLNDSGEIYYAGQGGLLRWDAVSGKCERIYRDTSLDPLKCEAILETSEDTVVMMYDDKDETYMLRLQLNGEREEKVLRIYQLFDDYGVKQYMDEYSRKHPGIKIESVIVKNEGDDMDMALNRLMTRLSAGETPDLFLIQREELILLQDKGVLAELQDLLPKELLGQIFPGALQYGTVEDKLYGVTTEVNVETLIVSGDVWQGETWSYKDVMGLMEEQGDAGGFECVFGRETPDKLLYHLAIRDIRAGNSSLVDEEKKECYFDSEEFVKILEFCRKYGKDADMIEYMDFQEQVEAMRSGKMLAMYTGGTLQDFSRTMSALGDNYRCVGYPTEGDYGGYASCYQCIAVNAASENQAAAVDFLEYLLSGKVQRSVGVKTVRRDILTGNVRNAGEPLEGGPWITEYPVFQNGAKEVVPLGGKSDGSSFLPEYLEILERAESMSSWMGEMEMIIIEEAAAYFNGDKTAKEAAEVIQSRIWLYLNER